MFKMTYSEAIEIQKEQIDFYAKFLTANKRSELAKMTKPCPFDPDEVRPVIKINELVPRGTVIEWLCGFGKQEV